MTYISLESIIDDILLLVRNNNISESEDLSRAQIALWIDSYRRKLWKDKLDRLRDLYKTNQYYDIEDLVDNEVLRIREKGPLELEPVDSLDNQPTFTKRTVQQLQNVFNNSENSILAVHDQSGETIQYMNHIKRHYQYWRKYTFGEMTAYYKDDGHIYVQGLQDQDNLKYIWVLALYEEDEDEGTDDEDTTDPDESDIKIPAWMVPPIKEFILKNELPFMLNRPSDDSNNATLASVKPRGPQDDEQ